MSYLSLCDWSLSKLGKFASFQTLQFPSTLSREKKIRFETGQTLGICQSISRIEGPNVFRGSKISTDIEDSDILLEFWGVKKQNEELNLGICLLGKQVFSFFYLVGIG